MTIIDATKDGANEGSFEDATLILYGTDTPSGLGRGSEGIPRNLQKKNPTSHTRNLIQK